MPTTMYLHDELSDVSLGTNNTNKLGSAVAWRSRKLLPTEGDPTNVTATVASVTGPTNGLETGSPQNEWISQPLSAAVTISGTITFNICAFESNAMANGGVGVVVQRLGNNLDVLSTIVDSLQSTELGTANARRTWTATPTSTAMAKGDRLRVRVYFRDVGGTMASAYTFTLTYDGLNSATGDSNVTFTESLSFMDWYPTSAATTYTTGGGAQQGIATDGTTYAIPSANGVIVTTNPTTSWSVADASVTTAGKMAYGNGVWVRTANTQIYTATSPYGPWTLRHTLSTGTGFYRCQYVNGTFVATITGALRIVWATDPTATWTETSIAVLTGTNTYDIAFGNGVWVAVSDAGGLATATTLNGTWTQRANPMRAATNSDQIYSVAYGNGLWVAAGDANGTNTTSNGTGICYMTATDPTGTWTLGLSAMALMPTLIVRYNAGVWFFGHLYGLAKVTRDPLTVAPVDVCIADFLQYNDVTYIGDTWTAVASNIVKVFTNNTVVYPTNVVSDIVDQGGTITEYKAWTSRGNG